MIAPEPYHSDDVEHLLRNAQLRDELEPLLDESIDCVNARVMSTRCENEFLESMLAWERAPMLPISKWFDPELVLPDPGDLTPAELSDLLTDVIQRLFTKRIVLDFTNHLSDYQLYTLIYRDILPSYEKKLDRASSYLHWDCANAEGDPEKWLRYYANAEERRMWADETDGDLPPRETPPYRRKLPEAPL